MDLAGKHLAILIILVLWKHDCLVVQILVLIGWIKLHFNVLVTMRIFAIEAARAGPLHKSALYRVFAGFSVNNLIAWVSVGSNTVTVRARKLGKGGWEYTFATATCTRTKTVHVHNGKGASNPQLSNQAHKYSRRSAWIMIHVVVAPTFSQNMHIFVLKNWSSYRLHETPSLVSYPFFHIFSILVMFVKFSFIASLFR